VDDTVLVGTRNAARDLAHDANRVFHFERATSESFAQRLARHEFHRDENVTVDLTDLVDGDEVGMADRGCGACFAEETSAATVVGLELRGKHFEGDGPAEALVLGAVDHPHAAPADPFDDAERSESPFPILREARRGRRTIGHPRELAQEGFFVRFDRALHRGVLAPSAAGGACYIRQVTVADCQDAEHSVRALCANGDVASAVGVAVRAYGPEIFGLLVALHGNDDDAGDAFSFFTESLWRGLPTFEWRCSLRTWAYLIARRASIRFREGRRRHDAHAARLSEVPELEHLAQRVRTETVSFLRTEKRDRLTALRDTLAEDDKLLLVLRIDKGLAWEDLARVMIDVDGEDEASSERLKRESARLRKRFQLVKEKLVRLAVQQGLLQPKRDP
jgi:RNA polymerase sigma-70 factor (ECF subfamily)